MGKRFSESHSKDSPLSPLDLGLGHKSDHVKVTDKETGNRGEGWGKNEREARDNAWRDLREKQGNK
jgi:hypothetical protein